MSWTPPPGTIGLTYSYGLTGFRASLGQLLVGESTRYNHAFIVLEGDTIIEPWPSGARITNISDYEGDYVAYGWLSGLAEQQQNALADAAMSLDGAPYGIPDYLALGAFRVGATRRVHRRVRDRRRLLPSQFVLEVYRRAGIFLFPDRDPAYVTFDDLGELLLTSPGWELRVPVALYV